MTETQLSSESSEVSLWMLPSLDDESELASPREDLLSRACAPSCCTMTRSPPAGQSMQHFLSVGDRAEPSEAAIT